MQPSETTQIQYLFPSHFALNSNIIPEYNQFNTIFNPSYQLQTTPQLQNLRPQSACLSSNSTSDETDVQQLSIINERKQRRIISNRESARRSRLRKQKQLHELRSQVVWLRNENQQIVEKLKRLLESRDRILQENDLIKEEISDLRRVIDEMQMNSCYPETREVGDDPCTGLPEN